MKLVQMPTDLLHLEDADLDGGGIAPGLLAAFRAYLLSAVGDPRGVAILAPASGGGRQLLMVLARRIGAALRDANIHLRDTGGDIKGGRQRLCYLPGRLVGAALEQPAARAELVREAACFFQDLDEAWHGEYPDRVPLHSDALLGLLDERLAAGRPTLLNAAPDRLSPGLEDALRARLPILEETSSERTRCER